MKFQFKVKYLPHRNWHNLARHLSAKLVLTLITITNCKSHEHSDFFTGEFGIEKSSPHSNGQSSCHATRRFTGSLNYKGETTAGRSLNPENLNLKKLCSSERASALNEIPEGERKIISSTLAILDRASDAIIGDYTCPWLTKEFLELTHSAKWEKAGQSAEKSNNAPPKPEIAESAPNSINVSEHNSAKSENRVLDVIDARLIAILPRLRVLIIDGVEIVYPGQLQKLKNLRHLVIQNIKLSSDDYFWIEKLSESSTLTKLDFISPTDDDSVLSEVKIYFDEVGILLKSSQNEEKNYNPCIYRLNNDLNTCPLLKIINHKTQLHLSPNDRNNRKDLALLIENEYLIRLDSEGTLIKVKTMGKNPKVGFVRQGETKCVAKFINYKQSNASGGTEKKESTNSIQNIQPQGKPILPYGKENQQPHESPIDDGFDFD